MSPIELQMADASKRAMDKLRSQGLSVNETYDYDAPSLPQEITEFPDDYVMDLYAKYVAYLEFINLQVWCAQTDKSEAEKEANLKRARKKLELKNSGRAVAMIDAEIEVDPDYQESATKYQELVNYHGLLSIMSEKLSKDISFINREITRRVSINKNPITSRWVSP